MTLHFATGIADDEPLRADERVREDDVAVLVVEVPDAQAPSRDEPARREGAARVGAHGASQNRFFIPAGFMPDHTR